MRKTYGDQYKRWLWRMARQQKYQERMAEVARAYKYTPGPHLCMAKEHSRRFKENRWYLHGCKEGPLMIRLPRITCSYIGAIEQSLAWIQDGALAKKLVDSKARFGKLTGRLKEELIELKGAEGAYTNQFDRPWPKVIPNLAEICALPYGFRDQVVNSTGLTLDEVERFAQSIRRELRKPLLENSEMELQDKDHTFCIKGSEPGSKQG